MRDTCLVAGVFEAAVGGPPVALQNAGEVLAEDAVGLLVAAARSDQVDGHVVADEYPQPLAPAGHPPAANEPPPPGAPAAHPPAGLTRGARPAGRDGEHQRLTRRRRGGREPAD